MALTVPENVRRIWDSERMEFSDDDPYELLEQVGGILIPDADLPDPDCDDDYRTDTLGEDYRIEEALEGCPFDFDELSDNMSDSGPKRGFENWTDNYPVDTGRCFEAR